MSVTRVILPKLGLTMDEGRLIAWHKKEGERVEKGEVLFEVETDKANLEIEASASGIVRRILLPADASAPVATVIALIADTADEPLPSGSESAGMPAESPLPRNDAPAPSSKDVIPATRSRPSLAETPPSPADSSTSPDGSSHRVRSSPAARKRALELGVDISVVRGTGPGGRVGLEDVEAASSSVSTSSASPSAATGEKREPLSRMRRAVAEAMTRSVREAPQFSISRDVDMTAANARRRDAGVSYTDVIVAAAATALRAHPRLRSRFDGDALVVSAKIDVGLAVALEAGAEMDADTTVPITTMCTTGMIHCAAAWHRSNDAWPSTPRGPPGSS